MSLQGVGGSSPQFETYLENWDANWQNALDSLSINSNTTVNIAFADFSLNPDGTFKMGGGNKLSESDLKSIVNEVHAKGGQIKISFGGATFPLSKCSDWPNTSKIAGNISLAIKKYGFDGADFDIEDQGPADPAGKKQFAQDIMAMITQIKDHNPGASLSLTLQGGAWGTYVDDLAPLAANSFAIDHINFMEYDVWIAPDSTYAKTILSDLAYYHAQWGVPYSKMEIGIMPGKDDMGHNLTLSDAQFIAQKAKELGCAGVMTWDLDRDFAGAGGESSDAYTNAIQTALWPKDKHSPFHIDFPPKRKHTAAVHKPKGPPLKEG